MRRYRGTTEYGFIIYVFNSCQTLEHVQTCKEWLGRLILKERDDNPKIERYLKNELLDELGFVERNLRKDI